MSAKPSIATNVAQSTYRGVWAVLRSLFRVPETPPSLPTLNGVEPRVTRPAPGYLRYLKFVFWLVLVIVDIGIIGAWIVILVVEPVVGAILAVPAWALAIIPDILAYVAIHLRYDTTWYVLSDRSMRLRRGVWIVQEVTITFDNVQNVSVRQGPLQRHFGIADVIVTTAGGGMTASPHGPVGGTGHVGLLEGVDNANELRELIMEKVRRSRGAGLGDERHDDRVPRPARPAFGREHVDALRAIRDEVRLLSAR